MEKRKSSKSHAFRNSVRLREESSLILEWDVGVPKFGTGKSRMKG